ncbi:ABC transporter permease subunit [Haloarcula sp. H-GB4]|uniref:ABC transporter permease n=1 Tax=Haloarcula sp. H-GB4 TaxID=3069755 RepID=UPI0027AFD75B|nr:ABC transporter permease subunit [Haloarcula sp. H-GB4]MDQ2072938.1 ABC transporter permease subunit [Haloarcula sp. H-GB4]
MALPRWFPVARKEATTLLKSKGTWILAPLLVVWGYNPTYISWDLLGPDVTVGFVQVAGSFLLPLCVLLLTYRSIIQERTSGSLKFLLGLPLTRTDILIGKVFGRSVGAVVPFAVSTIVLGVIGGFKFGLFSPLRFIGVFLVTVLYIVVLVSIATAASAVTTSTVRVTAVLFGGFFLLLTLGWKIIGVRLYSAVTGNAVNPLNPPADGLLFAILRISPDRAYRTVTNGILGLANSGDQYTLVATVLYPGHSVNAYVVDAAFSGQPVPAYLHESIALVVLLLWGVIPLALASYRFNRGDLA